MKPSVVLASLLLAAGCTTADSEGMIVVQNQLVDRQMAMCKVPVIQTMTAVTVGILDVGLVDAGYDGYHLYPLIENTLANMDNPAGGARNDITINGANIELRADATPAFGAIKTHDYFVGSFGGTVAPGMLTAMDIDALPRSVVEQFSAGIVGSPPNVTDLPVVTLRAQIVGTHASDNITSNWFSFPVRVCRWCLTGGPPAACVPFKTSEVQLGGCNPEMDFPVTCCTQNNTVVCGPNVPMQQ